MERKLDLRPCVIWVGGDAFVQIVDVTLKGSVSDLSLEVKALNKSGSVVVGAEYEIYFYDSIDTKLQDEAYIVAGENLSISPNDIGIALNINLSNSFPNARRAEVKLIKANFNDGKSIDLIYENMEKFAISNISREDLSLLQTVAGDDAICMPAKLLLNWRCICGYFNGDESELCSNCMRDQGQIFADYSSIDKIKEIIEKELLGEIDSPADDFLEDDLLKELYMDTLKEEEKEELPKEVVAPVVEVETEKPQEIKEDIVEDTKKEKIAVFKDVEKFFSQISKIGLIMILFSGIMISTSIFILFFRFKQ